MSNLLIAAAWVAAMVAFEALTGLGIDFWSYAFGAGVAASFAAAQTIRDELGRTPRPQGD